MHIYTPYTHSVYTYIHYICALLCSVYTYTWVCMNVCMYIHYIYCVYIYIYIYIGMHAYIHTSASSTDFIVLA